MILFFYSADLPMSFEDRVAAVGIATQFQEYSKDVLKMVDEETEYAKTQVTIILYAVNLFSQVLFRISTWIFQ